MQQHEPLPESLNEELASVVAVQDDHVLLAARDVSTCGSCAARSGCGHGWLDSLSRGRRRTLTLPRSAVPSDVVVGEQLLVGIPRGAIVRAAALVYGLPLAGLVVGAVLAPGGDGAALLAACIGFGLGWLLARRLHGRHAAARLRCRRSPAAMPGRSPLQAEPRAHTVV